METTTANITPSDVNRACDTLGDDRVAIITGGTPIGSCSIATLRAIVQAARSEA